MVNEIFLALDYQTMKISAIVLLAFVGLLALGVIVWLVLNIINSKNIENDELPDLFEEEVEDESLPEEIEKSAFEIDNSDISMFDENNEAYEIINSIRDASENESSVSKNKFGIFRKNQ